MFGRSRCLKLLYEKHSKTSCPLFELNPKRRSNYLYQRNFVTTTRRFCIRGTANQQNSTTSLVEHSFSYRTDRTYCTTTRRMSTETAETAAASEVESVKAKYLEMSPENKRSYYKCREKYVQIDGVKSWDKYATEIELPRIDADSEESDVKYEASERLNNKVSIWRGDITTLEIDAIVNAANNSLLGGGGVDGAIHSAAGKALFRECELLNGCDTGGAKITGGYKLPAKYVIHTVGPRGEKPVKLFECYSNSLNLMKEKELRTIAFPCISTGIYGYPSSKAAHVALKTVRSFLEENSEKVDRVIFCIFLKEDLDIYHKLMQLYFPLPN